MNFLPFSIQTIAKSAVGQNKSPADANDRTGRKRRRIHQKYLLTKVGGMKRILRGALEVEVVIGARAVPVSRV